jgi:hypothetical protein
MNTLSEKRSPVTEFTHTPFMDAFTAEFIFGEGVLWPAKGQCLDSINEDLRTFMNVLTQCALMNSSPAAVPNAGMNLKLYARLVQFLDHFKNPAPDPVNGWPTGCTDVTHVVHSTLRLWEVSVIAQILLGAAALRKGGPDEGVLGGQGSGWPPHRP